MDLIVLMQGIGIGLSVAMPVGPITLLCLYQTLLRGYWFGMACGAGAASAAFLWGIVVHYGSQIVLSVFGDHSNGLQVMGGLMVCYFGIRTGRFSSSQPTLSYPQKTPIGAFLIGISIAIANPVTILLVTSLLLGSIFLNRSLDGFESAIVLIGMVIGIVGWWSIFCGGITFLKKKISISSLQQLNRTMAAILTVFGAVVFFRASSQIVAGDGFFSTPFLPEFVFFGIGMAATIAAILLIVKSPVSLIIRDEDKKTNSSVKHWRFPNIKHWRFPVRNWVLPILLLPIAAQSAFLLWLHRTEIVQLFFRPQISRCLAPAADTQLCSAMKDVSNVPAGQFFYGGAMGTAALRSPPLLDKLQLAHPSFHLHYLDPLVVAPDSTTGIQMLIRGELSFAESQRPLRDAEYRQARLRGFHLRQIPVATTGVAFFTHPDLSLPGLSLDQVQAIYTGQLTNWQQVGGPNLPIVPISQDTNREGCTMRLLLQGLPPAEQHLSRQVARVQDTTASLRQVAATPGAIGFGTQALVVNQQSVRLIGLAKWRSRQYVPPATPDGQVNQAALRNGTYPLMQRLFVVVREDGTLDELAGIAYANLLLSEEGQLSSQRAGYLPVRSTVIESRQIARARSISVLAGARRWPLAGSLEPLLLFPEP